jgi:hypothetical protein
VRGKSPRALVYLEAEHVGHEDLGVDDDFLEALLGFVNGLAGNKQQALSDSKEVRPSMSFGLCVSVYISIFFYLFSIIFFFFFMISPFNSRISVL